MNNKELREKAQDYTEENGINRNTNQIEKAFIDGALMILNQAKNNESLHDFINCDCETDNYTKHESTNGIIIYKCKDCGGCL